jgi:predicted DNA-binding transcriptional regulator YafY
MSVALRYRGLDRTVDPWGLVLRDGFWYLVAFDHARGERRTFRIDRIEGDVRVLDGASFERPEGFDPREAVPTDPKMIGATDVVPDARVWIDAARAPAAVAELGEHRVVARRADGSVEVDVPCANAPAFRSWVLGFLEHAEVLAPAEIRDDVVAWLQAVGR